MTNTAFDLWDEREVLVTVVDELLHATRDPLSASVVHPTCPGLYLLFYTGPTRWYRRIAGGTWPVYCGSASALRARLRRHVLKADRVRHLAAGDLWVATVAMPSHAAAVYAEALTIARLRPVWNEAWISGFGSQAVGSGRSQQRPSAFSRLHPRSGPHARRRRDGAVLAERVAAYLDHTVPSYAWRPLRPPAG